MVGVLELVIAAVCFFGKNKPLATQLVAWLATMKRVSTIRIALATSLLIGQTALAAAICGYILSNNTDACSTGDTCSMYTYVNPGNQSCYGPGLKWCDSDGYGIATYQTMVGGTCSFGHCTGGEPPLDAWVSVYQKMKLGLPCGG